MIAHDVISYVCADQECLRRPIPVTPYLYDELETQPLNEGYRLQMREGGRAAVRSRDPDLDETAYDGGFPVYNKPDRGITARDVLALYSAEPDWGMDDDLSLSPLQHLTGGSQGYRHMRYGLFCFRVGKAHDRAVYYTKLARKVFEKKDLYWGLRFSGRALHYIQDALSPFHTKPFPECSLPVLMWRPKRLYFITYNYHLNFERMVGYYLWHGKKSFIDCIEASEPLQIDELKGRLLVSMRAVRRLAVPLFRECRKLWGNSMSTAPYKISSDQIVNTSVSPRMREHICVWFKIMSGFVKGYIEKYVGAHMLCHEAVE